jgi:hypothetical protein
LLDVLIDVLAERVADKMATRIGASSPRYATARENPIGSARAFLDAARRGDFPTFRRGRCVAALWTDVERYVENRKPLKGPAVPNDRDTLLRRGLVFKRPLRG